MQQLLDATALNAGGSKVTVSYDFATQGFKFLDGTNTITLKSGTTKNDVLGLTTTAVTANETGNLGTKAIPNGSTLRAFTEQRYGMKMTYDSVNKIFKLSSGKTGDESSVAVTGTSAAGIALFGFSDSAVTKSNLAVRGIDSTPAVTFGTTPTVNLANNFAVDATNNSFVVTVDGIKGTVKLPIDSNYSLSTFMAKLQTGINALGSNSSINGTPTTVNGVKVSYDAQNNRFKFTTGTTGEDAFIKISGSNAWGLETVEAGRGTTTTWIKPTQHQDYVGGAFQPKYIDGDGNETTNGDGFTTLPAWSPVFLDKGELTFDTGGILVSPKEGTQLETVYLAGGKGALTINIDYSASTQFSSAFAVLSQSQDGAPEGDLVGVTIGNDGLVSASFSNGSQKSLAKILLANFSSPVGLRQIGDSSFLTSAASGKPILGTPGSAGFGTLRAGATERANVDLTQELVDLITAQRNFQANAKAIETSSTMTSAIINLRS
jgi:flagellar hook-basal body protein